MKWLLYTFTALAVGLLCSCSKEIAPDGDDGTIVLMPVMDKGKSLTRALLYKTESEMRDDFFHTHAYLQGTSTAYFSSDVKYSDEDRDPSKHRWDFYSTGAYKDYYWPVQGSLDFFAYVPSNNGYVTVNSAVNPPTFTATMPLVNTGSGIVHQGNMKEFMYAYITGQDKSVAAVPLAFEHPFAAIVFKVSQSHRDLTVRTITIKDIAHKGTCSFAAENSGVPVWEMESSGNLLLSVEKIIPGDVNFGGELCGPYLVLPQNNNEPNKKGITIKFHWKGTPDSGWKKVDGEDYTYEIDGKIADNWEAGKIYTYTLDLGNSREEILFKVNVAPWRYVYEHIFDIE